MASWSYQSWKAAVASSCFARPRMGVVSGPMTGDTPCRTGHRGQAGRGFHFLRQVVEIAAHRRTAWASGWTRYRRLGRAARLPALANQIAGPGTTNPLHPPPGQGARMLRPAADRGCPAASAASTYRLSGHGGRANRNSGQVRSSIDQWRTAGNRRNHRDFREAGAAPRPVVSGCAGGLGSPSGKGFACRAQEGSAQGNRYPGPVFVDGYVAGDHEFTRLSVLIGLRFWSDHTPAAAGSLSC